MHNVAVVNCSKNVTENGPSFLQYPSLGWYTKML